MDEGSKEMNGKNGSIEFYEYRPYWLVVPGFTLLECLERGKASLKLDYTRNYKKSLEYDILCELESNGNIHITISAVIGDGIRLVSILALSSTPRKIRDSSIYIITGSNITEAEAWSNEVGYLRLLFRKSMDAPTLFINGVHMHQIDAPLHDSQRKVARLHITGGDVVLDTCMGLGYTAITAAVRGASLVYTVEVSKAVIELSRFNPASWLLSSANIRVVNADILDFVEAVRDDVFDKIIHDPPRFELAGELYSLAFYKQLFRILKRGGRLYHYVGMPRKSRGRGYGPIVRGVMDRLRKAGFYVKGYDESSAGIIAVKY